MTNASTSIFQNINLHKISKSAILIIDSIFIFLILSIKLKRIVQIFQALFTSFKFQEEIILMDV